MPLAFVFLPLEIEYLAQFLMFSAHTNSTWMASMDTPSPALTTKRPEDHARERITIEPGKCGGRPCIRGMRIRVTDVLGMLAAGMSRAEILADFPYLEADDITACLSYAASLTEQRMVSVAHAQIPD
jgi:uncharacterized protein (DUF433 family)